LFDGVNGALTVDALFDQMDKLADNADERGQAILGALYDYVEMIAPQRD
jgi:exodeoxyribonuclease-1